MTSKEKIKTSLEKYNFSNIEKNSEIIIKLDFSHQINVNFYEKNKIIITDKLVSWNFLTGMIEMSLKNAMIYNFVCILFMSFLCLYSDLGGSTFKPINLFLGFSTWVLLFSTFYVIKSENLKQNIINWSKE